MVGARKQWDFTIAGSVVRIATITLAVTVSSGAMAQAPQRGSAKISHSKKSAQKTKKSQTTKKIMPKSVNKSGSSGRTVAPQKATEQMVAKPNVSANLTPMELFLKARNFFAVGKYEQAIQFASAARDKIPTSNFPVILMAQSYYRLGNVSKAVALFRSVDISEILPEAAVDYALSMFAGRQYSAVIKIFPLVPEGHPYRDIVKFYVGVSYMNYEQYAQAQKYLRKAGNLPASLKSQRRRLLSEIDDLGDRNQSAGRPSQAFSQNQFQYYAPPAPPPELLPGGTPGNASADKHPAAQPAALAKSSISYSAKPSVGFTVSSTKKDFSGTNESRSESKTPAADLTLGAKFLGNARSFGSQPSLDLNLTPAFSHTDSKSTASNLTASIDDPNNIQNNITTTESASFFFQKTYNVSALYPINEPVDVGASYTVVDQHTDARTDSNTTTPSANLVAEFGDLKLDTSWTQVQTITKPPNTEKTDKTSTTLKFGLQHNGDNATTSGTISQLQNSKPALDGGIKSRLDMGVSWRTTWDSFSLTLAGSKSDSTRLTLSASGAALSKWSLNATGSYTLPFGMSLDLLCGYSSLSNIVTQNAAVAPETTATEAMGSATASQLSLTVKGTIASFLTLSGNYDYTSRSPSIGDPAFQKKLLSEQWSQQTMTVFSMSASYSF